MGLSYEDSLQFIHSRPKLLKSGRLDRMDKVLAFFKHPEQNQRWIHITGTNGKGAVANDLTHLLTETGLNVGTFTSPFITRFNERIKYNNLPIDDEMLAETTTKLAICLTDLQQQHADFDLTEFEIVTLIMFLFFETKQLDVGVIEVGIGGEHDSTNVLTPQLSVITTVGMDHMQMLGDTLTEIAAEKSGIIKQDKPVVLGKLPNEAQTIMLRRAKQMNSLVYTLGEAFTTKLEPVTDITKTNFSFQNSEVHLKNLQLPSIGEFQVDNAAVAIQTYWLYLKQMAIPFSSRIVKKALKNAFWAGRTEVVSTQPYIILDGAHNEPGIRQLTTAIETRFRHQEIYYLFCAMADKAIDKMLPYLTKNKRSHLQLTTISYARSAKEADYLADGAADISFEPEWQKALVQTVQQMSADDVFVICGSLYFISQVRPFFEVKQS